MVNDNLAIILCYPHGLGDIILSTPLLRHLKINCGYYIGFAMLERFRSSKILDNCPYVDEIFYTKDAWNEYPNFEYGVECITNDLCLDPKSSKYDQIIPVIHEKGKNKIRSMCDMFGLGEIDYRTEVFITKDDKFQALKPLIAMSKKDCDTESLIPPYAFIHSKTGLPIKDLPLFYGKEWVNKYFPHIHNNFIEVGVHFKYDDYNINVQFEMARRSTVAIIPDSVFYHYFMSINRDPDLVYFGRGEEAFNTVHPLHRESKNIFYKLPTL